MKENVLGALTLGEAIRRIRKRLDKNTTDFGKLVGSTSASISRYENGKLTPSRSMAMLLRSLAQTPEETAALDDFLGQSDPPAFLRQANNPIAAIRAISKMGGAAFASAIGLTLADLKSLEDGGLTPARSVLDRLERIAVTHGRPDLAVSLGEWVIRHVIAPGETLISASPKRVVERSPKRADNDKTRLTEREQAHELLDEIYDSGMEDAKVAVYHNLVVFGNYVRARRKSTPGRKRAG